MSPDTLAQRAARGEYDLVVPLDYRLMEALEEEGTTLAGLYEIGTTVKQIRKQYPMLASTVISTRLRLLQEQGLTRKMRLIGGGQNGGAAAWQHTKKGSELIRKWKEESGESG